MVVYFGLLLLAFAALIIDRILKSGLKVKEKFELRDSIKFIIIGVMGTVFFASGIFILLKGVLIFFLFVGTPLDKLQIPPEAKPVSSPEAYRMTKPQIKPDIGVRKEEQKEPTIEPTPLTTMAKEKDIITDRSVKIEEELGKVGELEEILIKAEKERKEEE